LTLPKYNCLIIDEAHYFSGMRGFRKKSGMLKALLWYIKKYDPKCIYGLTATPYLSTPWNIYALAQILGRNWNYMTFKHRFFYDVNMGRRYPVPVIKGHIENDIADLVNKLGNTVRLDECVDVPEQIFLTEYFELTPTQKKVIKELDDIVHISRWTKTHQICGGTLKGDGYIESTFYESEKMKRLLDLCEEHKKLVIVCRYNNELSCLYNKLDSFKNKAIINGSVKDRHDIIKQADKEESFILLIQAACSEGYELPSFPIMIFYSYDFSLKNYIQMIGRIQRINAIKKNVYISLVVKNTIDEDVKKSIDNKKDFDIAIYNK